MRLVDADALIERIKSYNWGDIDGIVDIVIKQTLEDVKKQPTADAISVVRCKDCIYYNRGWSVKYEMHMMFCDHFRVGCGNRSYPEDFFCGFGERREEE